ncbi:hypothetical protein KGD82_16405 [Nocardiopsis eucommiae]|uniref:Uncharacterized protein n=1 Tax=Nocardiopsis eucommiae TaxID=2831970 RepID=A0A975L800_9ACTN|nr:hypothetical protein KGD82_16405 [Nocardiopsis eucommiae]
MSRRENAQFYLTAATCWFGFFAAISLLSGNWMYFVFGVLCAFVVYPLMLLVGFGTYRFFGWVLRVNR